MVTSYNMLPVQSKVLQILSWPGHISMSESDPPMVQRLSWARGLSPFLGLAVLADKTSQMSAWELPFLDTKLLVYDLYLSYLVVSCLALCYTSVLFDHVSACFALLRFFCIAREDHNTGRGLHLCPCQVTIACSVWMQSVLPA
jgi:hypothetical protein